MINKEKARPAKKQTVQTHQEQTTDTRKGLSKVEGVITSALQIKYEPENNKVYCYAFFQLEGLDQDIPVIFKLDRSVADLEANKPNIPPRTKVLLEGHWAEPNNSTRPSFTCLAWEIIANPPPITIKSLREQISLLLTTSLEKQTEWKQRTDYLFQRLNYLKDLDKLTKLGDQYLQAYLLLKSASYANYQNNLLPHTTDLTNYDHYLTKIQKEIEEIAQHIRAYQSKEPSL